MKSQVLQTVWCHIPCQAAGEFWHWSLSGVKGLITLPFFLVIDRLMYSTVNSWCLAPCLCQHATPYESATIASRSSQQLKLGSRFSFSMQSQCQSEIRSLQHWLNLVGNGSNDVMFLEKNIWTVYIVLFIPCDHSFCGFFNSATTTALHDNYVWLILGFLWMQIILKGTCF